MVDYLTILSQWMEKPHYLLIILISVYVIAALIDFLIGTFNAAYTSTIPFSSRVCQLGIIRKLVTLAVMMLIIPMALILPFEIGVYSLMGLYTGIAISEIYSILGHIGIVKDGEKHKNIVGDLLTELIEKIYNSKNKTN